MSMSNGAAIGMTGNSNALIEAYGRGTASKGDLLASLQVEEDAYLEAGDHTAAAAVRNIVAMYSEVE